jgi:hypothetical protein
LKGSHTFSVKDTGGKERGLEEMIMEEVPLLEGYNWRLKILVQIFGGLVDHENVVGLEFIDGEVFRGDGFHFFY